MGVLTGNGFLPLVADLATYSITPKNGDGLVVADLNGRVLTWDEAVSTYSPPLTYQQGSITPGAWVDGSYVAPGLTKSVATYGTNATPTVQVGEQGELIITVTAPSGTYYPRVTNLASWPANVLFKSCEFSGGTSVVVLFDNETGDVLTTFNIAIEVVSFV